jgi:NitT/TauT family transport system ATP-binding protein
MKDDLQSIPSLKKIKPIRLTLEKVSKIYHTHNGPVMALQEISFVAEQNEFICIVGPSGCGKTTLLKLIDKITDPTSGNITFSGEHPRDRQTSVMVFQEESLFPWMTVEENIAFGLDVYGIDPEEIDIRVNAHIRKYGLRDFRSSYPRDLSGGMKQRVAIARAILAESQIMLMDEPFGSLDAQTRLLLQNELLQIWEEEQKLVIYVTHDIEEAILLGDRIFVMSGRPGRILEEIDVPLERPRNLLTGNEQVVATLKGRIWDLIKDEVHLALEMSH